MAREGKQGTVWGTAVCVCLRAGNVEAAIDGPLSRVALSHTQTHTHTTEHTLI